MKKSLFLLFLISFVAQAHASDKKYFIKFKDKNNSSYSVTEPGAFLSQRAIKRRAAQNIRVTMNDLPVNSNYIEGVVSQGAAVISKSKWLNGITVECDSVVFRSILTLPFVESGRCIYGNSGYESYKELEKSIPLNYSSELRIATGGYGQSFNQIHLMNGEYLHQEGFRGEGMLIALLDAGFFAVDQLSPFDSVRNNIIATWDFVSNNSMVYDDDTHGMSVLSTIAGNVPGQLLGTAPGASFLLLRTEDSSSEYIIEEYNWAAGAEYADSAGADVISSSLGYTVFDDTTTNHVYADMDGDHCPSSIAADIAASKGMLVVNSAGNQGVNPWHYISAPSDGDSVISVGAVDSLGFHIYFSSFGPAADGDVKPNVSAQGFECTIADGWGGISTGNGTSFACPILAGAATCLWQANPAFTAMEIKTAIEQSANFYNSPNDSMGFGIPDFRIARFILTSGKIDAQSKDYILEVYPNPFSENLNVSFYSHITQKIDVKIIDALGRVLSLRKTEAVGAAVNTFTFSGESIVKKGIYFVIVSTNKETFVNRVVKH